MPTRLDLTGKTFGRLTVLAFSHMQQYKTSTKALWLCGCECGTEKIVHGASLQKGYTKSCGCLQRELAAASPHVVDMLGQRYGRLTVLRRSTEKSKDCRAYWECLCDCSTLTVSFGKDLRSGHTKSCGCLQREKAQEHLRTHGKTRTREYRIWRAMKRRCEYEKDPAYKNYGGRGITIGWPSFEAFLADMGPWPGKGYSVERRNNELGYFPGNVYWGTRREQNRNKRNTLRIVYNGVEKPAIEWAEIFGINYKHLYYKLRKGFSVEQIISHVNLQTGGPLRAKDSQ